MHQTHKYKISVIIPVYNVEKYIEKCVESLFNQTFDSIEYIFIVDASPDESYQKILFTLDKYPDKKKDVRFILHDHNKGVAASRAEGIIMATGEYLIHCDPDDFVEPDIYRLLYEKAILSNADIVVCDLAVEYFDHQEIVSYHFKGSPLNYLKEGRKNNFNYANLYNKLIKKSIFDKHKILPYKGCDYGEDLGIIIQVLYYAKRIEWVNIPLYHYCRRQDSITGRFLTYEVFVTRVNLTKSISEFLEKRKMKLLAATLKFNLKTECRQFFRTQEKEDEWFDLFKESHKYILFFPNFSLKERLLWFLALNNRKAYKFFLHKVKKI